jgi:hypothetical protein
MRPEDRITAGKSINEALSAFRESVNQPDTLRAAGQWLVLNLDHIQQLLSEPITREEAQTLLDVLYKRRWMEELIRWLTDRPATWEDFATYEGNLREEAKRKWAEHGGRCRDLKLFPERCFPAISDSCPDCGSSEWKPIAYGKLAEEDLERARSGNLCVGVAFGATRSGIALLASTAGRPNRI